MRIAVFSSDKELRYVISRFTEEALLRCGILPEMVLFPTIGELSENASLCGNTFNFVFISGTRDASALRELCKKLPVILIGSKEDGVFAYEVGAKYYLEIPIEASDIEKAITYCQNNKE